ncbi:hypothetical protein, partial [Nocardia mangyaensis]|uniref:hypothetical protein n=1 Tax=Nocardia mangyaensis TaxID=2213200 RepID=UPI002677061B
KAEFDKKINTPNVAPVGTGTIDFLLMDISHKGKSFCQILEAPGEHFFKFKDDPTEENPVYINEILSASYRKVFLFFFEIGMFDSDQARNAYIKKIERVVGQVSAKKNRVIIVCNKCDQQNHFKNGRPILKQYKKTLVNKKKLTATNRKKLNITPSKTKFHPK